MEFLMHLVAPFRLDLTVSVLRRVPINQMDRWDGNVYRRILVMHGKPSELSVVQTGTPAEPELAISYDEKSTSDLDENSITHILTRIFGLDIDLANFYTLATHEPQFSELVNRFVGFKPPRAHSVFEALINAIACQQLSLTVGITLLNRLSAAYGIALDSHHAFPRPEDLINASTDDLKSLGFSTRKAEYILAISRSIANGELDLDSLEHLGTDLAISTLCKIHGIGRWTAEYVALRGLGRLDVYPADDIGSQNKLQSRLGLTERPDYRGVQEIIKNWSPYRGLIYFHMLLDSLDRQGLL